MADIRNTSGAFEQRIKDSLEQFEVPYNSSDWAQLEQAMDGPRSVRWWTTPGMIAALLAGTLVVGGTAYLLTQRNAPVAATQVPTVSAEGDKTAAQAQLPVTAALPSATNPAENTNADSNTSDIARSTGTPSGTEGTSPSTQERTVQSGTANEQTSSVGTNKSVTKAAPTGGSDVPKNTGNGTATTAATSGASGEMTFKASVSAACPGEEVVFKVENMPTGGIYLWNFGDGSFSNKPNPEHTFTKPGNYQVMLSMSAAGVGTIHNKPSSDIISIHEAPKASFNAQKQDFEGHIPSVHFENRSNGAKQYHWDFGDGSTSSVAHPDHIYKKKGVYPVKLQVTSEKGCMDIYEREVRIENDYNLDAPAKFAPTNAETFMPEALRTLGVKFHLMVYTADGQLVYETSDATKPWTGRMNNRGEVLAKGDYVWVVDVRERIHLDETYTGKVTLDR
ncbi:MAG: PKD domain-containing protein [Flavobacteriales bacterium]|nr:PKD domain-containing protein [Flavobacteriales bacterium]